MNYYWFNRQEILEKAKEKYSKDSIIKTFQNKKKTKLKSIKEKNIKNWFSIKKKR